MIFIWGRAETFLSGSCFTGKRCMAEAFAAGSLADREKNCKFVLNSISEYD